MAMFMEHSENILSKQEFLIRNITSGCLLHLAAALPVYDAAARFQSSSVKTMIGQAWEFLRAAKTYLKNQA